MVQEVVITGSISWMHVPLHIQKIIMLMLSWKKKWGQIFCEISMFMKTCILYNLSKFQIWVLI